MLSAASNDNGLFTIEGPDEKGDAWLICDNAGEETVIGLGSAARAAAILGNWIASLDHQPPLAQAQKQRERRIDGACPGSLSAVRRPSFRGRSEPCPEGSIPGLLQPR